MNAALTPAEAEHLNHVASARADYLSEAFGDEARLLDAQARDDARNEGIACRLLSVDVLRGEHGRKLTVVVTRPVPGFTPANLAHLPKVAYVIADPGYIPASYAPPRPVECFWHTVEDARDIWASLAKVPGYVWSPEDTAKARAWYADIRENGAR